MTRESAFRAQRSKFLVTAAIYLVHTFSLFTSPYFHRAHNIYRKWNLKFGRSCRVWVPHYRRRPQDRNALGLWTIRCLHVLQIHIYKKQSARSYCGSFKMQLFVSLETREMAFERSCDARKTYTSTKPHLLNVIRAAKVMRTFINRTNKESIAVYLIYIFVQNIIHYIYHQLYIEIFLSYIIFRLIWQRSKLEQYNNNASMYAVGRQKRKKGRSGSARGICSGSSEVYIYTRVRRKYNAREAR